MTELQTLIKEEEESKNNIITINLPSVPMSSIISEEKKIQLSKIGIETFCLDARDTRSFLNALNSLSHDYILGKCILLSVKKSNFDNNLTA